MNIFAIIAFCLKGTEIKTLSVRPLVVPRLLSAGRPGPSLEPRATWANKGGLSPSGHVLCIPPAEFYTGIWDLFVGAHGRGVLIFTDLRFLAAADMFFSLRLAASDIFVKDDA